MHDCVFMCTRNSEHQNSRDAIIIYHVMYNGGVNTEDDNEVLYIQ